MTFDLALIQKPGESGLSKSEIAELLGVLPFDAELYPVEIYANTQECSAMGFITNEAANKLDYDYEASGLNTFIADILDDVNHESADNTYKFKDIDIMLRY